MNTNLLNIAQQIIAGYGEAVLADSARLKAFFSDLAKDEPKPLRISFGLCIEAGAYAALKTAADASERTEHKALVAQKVRDEQGLDIGLCSEAMDILEAALFAAAPAAPPPVYAAPENVIVVSTPAKKHTVRNVLIAVMVVAETIMLVLFWRSQKSVLLPIPNNMVFIEGGTFMMGSPASEPERMKNEVPHRVTVSSFYMSRYEVTQREWQEVMGNNPSYFKGDNLPVETVSWYDVVEYCNKRSEREGLTSAYTIDKSRWDNDNTSENDDVHWMVLWNRNANGYRLPTAAEWEYACRAGTVTPFHTGNNITTTQANYNGNHPYNNGPKGVDRGMTWAVGSGVPNAWGLYDMHGNVWEWCWDWYEDHSDAAQTNPQGPATGWLRVNRGGGWGGSSAQFLRSAFWSVVAGLATSGDTPTRQSDDLGFRLARNAQ
jgi:formylglycine-generating enzyme required for sulfatase activity